MPPQTFLLHCCTISGQESNYWMAQQVDVCLSCPKSQRRGRRVENETTKMSSGKLKSTFKTFAFKYIFLTWIRTQSWEKWRNNNFCDSLLISFFYFLTTYFEDSSQFFLLKQSTCNLSDHHHHSRLSSTKLVILSVLVFTT